MYKVNWYHLQIHNIRNNYIYHWYRLRKAKLLKPILAEPRKERFTSLKCVTQHGLFEYEHASKKRTNRLQFLLFYNALTFAMVYYDSQYRTLSSDRWKFHTKIVCCPCIIILNSIYNIQFSWWVACPSRKPYCEVLRMSCLFE